MIGLHVRLARFCFFVLAVLGLVAVAAHAQAPIDPALLPAPLPQTEAFSAFPGYEDVVDPSGPVAPLTPQQKFQIAGRETFSLELPVDALFLSSFSQATNLGPDYGQGWDAFGERLGYNAANFTSKTMFEDAIVPVAFHQDPRYFRMGGGPVRRRVMWILRSQVIAFSDRGTEMPNCGKLVGYAASTAFSNLYMPRQSISFGNDVKSYGIKFGVSVGVDLVREFDLMRFIRKR